MLTTRCETGKFCPGLHAPTGEARQPSRNANLPAESAAGSGIMIVLAVGLPSRWGWGPRWRSSNDYGRRRNPEVFAASLSLLDGGRRAGNGAPEENRWGEKRQHQRSAFSRALSWKTGDAGRSDHRSD